MKFFSFIIGKNNVIIKNTDNDDNDSSPLKPHNDENFILMGKGANINLNATDGTQNVRFAYKAPGDSNNSLTVNNDGLVNIPNVNVDGGSIDDTPIGATTASTGKFTTLETTELQL